MSLNAALERIDTILGPSVTPSRLNLNADVELNGNDLTEVRSVRFENQGSLFSASDDVGCLYFYNNNAYIRNSAGTNVQVTNGGSLASVPTSNNWTQQSYTTSQSITAALTWNEALVDTVAGNVTFTLDAASGFATGRYMVFTKTTTDTNTIVFTPNGTDTINGVNSSFTLRGASSACILVKVSSTGWAIMGLQPPGTLNGATVPSGTSLTTGNVLQASGAAALTYGPLNLAGGSNYVTGVLPAANLPATVAYSGTDLYISGSNAYVGTVTGSSGTLTVSCGNVTFGGSISTPTISQETVNDPFAGEAFTIRAQAGGSAGNTTGGALNLSAGAAAGANSTGGAVTISSGVGGSGTGVDGAVKLMVGSTVAIKADEVADGRRVASLFIDSTSTTAGTGGSNFLHIGNANQQSTSVTAPTVGVSIWSDVGAGDPTTGRGSFSFSSGQRVFNISGTGTNAAGTDSGWLLPININGGSSGLPNAQYYIKLYI